METLTGVGGRGGGLHTRNKDLIRPLYGMIVPYPPKGPYDHKHKGSHPEPFKFLAACGHITYTLPCPFLIPRVYVGVLEDFRFGV